MIIQAHELESPSGLPLSILFYPADTRRRSDPLALPSPIRFFIFASMINRSVRVTIYSKTDCDLCEIAKERVENVRRSLPFCLEEVDVGAAPRLHDRYGERVPVVTVNGEEVCVYRVNEKLLTRKVKEAARKGTVRRGGSSTDRAPARLAHRLLGTFLHPGRTFSSIRVHSSLSDWVVPWSIGSVVSVGAVYGVGPIILREALIDRAPSSMTGMTGLLIGVTPLISLSVLFLLSGIYFGVANFMLNGFATFHKVLVVQAYSGMIRTLGDLILSFLVVMKQPTHVGVGPGLLMPPGTELDSKFLLAYEIDIFTIWYLTVVSIGIGIVSGIPWKKVGIVLFTLWVLFVAAKSVMRIIFVG